MARGCNLHPPFSHRYRPLKLFSHQLHQPSYKARKVPTMLWGIAAALVSVHHLALAYHCPILSLADQFNLFQARAWQLIFSK